MEKTEIISDKATFSKFAASGQVTFLWRTYSETEQSAAWRHQAAAASVGIQMMDV